MKDIFTSGQVREKLGQIDAVISTMGDMMQEFKGRIQSMEAVIESNARVTLNHYSEVCKNTEGLDTVVRRLDGFEAGALKMCDDYDDHELMHQDCTSQTDKDAWREECKRRNKETEEGAETENSDAELMDWRKEHI